ncbi:glycerate kinase family protein [Cyclobacterium jeungdonense]|uniref:Glycerate kinase n=1 Tax=Cyclobacterium jeungdonense TaxID=708087 RepID=A0ABT8CAT2_9BACT|nr:glycerate kinase [Cyclobacterium jeungdonense]MDN3688786.1 glycerate kinase [Cyclobacterium jeungdonense]
MKWLIAPNAFKGTLEAEEAAAIIEKTIQECQPKDQTDCCPIADGGDGTCLLLSKQLGLEKVEAWVCGPLGRSHQAFFGYDPTSRTAFLDVSTASGIKDLKDYEKNPWICSTYGTGQLIARAVEKGADQVVLGLGGSATIDMGTGILQALGLRFLDKNGRELIPFVPEFLEKIAHIQLPVKLPSLRFTCLCDVGNTFFGKEGAIPVFGPQKGLPESQQPRFLEVSQKLFERIKKKSKWDLTDRACYGAAGGIAMGLYAFFPVQLEQGARYFFEKTGMEQRIQESDIVVTGEGRFDAQSAHGKGSYELLQLAKKYGKKSWLITSGEEGLEAGFDEVIPMPDLDFAAPDLIERAKSNLRKALLKKFS